LMVKVQISPSCPKCDKLLEELFRAGIEYGFEVLPEIVDTTFEPFYTKDSASKIYNEEWIQKHGSKKQRELYKKAKPIVDIIGQTTATPVIEITWNYGQTDRSLVIKGFTKDLSEKGIKNIVRAVLMLLRLERLASTPVGRPIGRRP